MAYGKEFLPGNIIGVRYDSNLRTIHFSNDQTCFGMAYDENDIKKGTYYPFFNLDSAGESISLCTFNELPWPTPFQNLKIQIK